jgi:hypothetical protein
VFVVAAGGGGIIVLFDGATGVAVSAFASDALPVLFSQAKKVMPNRRKNAIGNIFLIFKVCIKAKNKMFQT